VEKRSRAKITGKKAKKEEGLRNIYNAMTTSFPWLKLQAATPVRQPCNAEERKYYIARKTFLNVDPRNTNN